MLFHLIKPFRTREEEHKVKYVQETIHDDYPIINTIKTYLDEFFHHYVSSIHVSSISDSHLRVTTLIAVEIKSSTFRPPKIIIHRHSSCH